MKNKSQILIQFPAAIIIAILIFPGIFSCKKETPVSNIIGTTPLPPPPPPPSYNPYSGGIIIPGSIKVGTLSGPSTELTSVACKDKFYFAGGSNGDAVDIFDPATNTTDRNQLSIGRTAIAGISVADKVYFAGGFIYHAPSTAIEAVSRIDIYNTQTMTWSSAELSLARYGISTATLDDKIFFAGGRIGESTTSRVDIYDIQTNTWSQHELSKPGTYVSVVLENKIWFVTYGTSKVDIYDSGTESWSSILLPFSIYDQLPSTIYNHTAINLNSKIYFAGNHVIRVFDIPSKSWSTLTLSENKFAIPVGVSNNKIAFIGGMTSWFEYSTKIEIYDPINNTWSYLEMTTDLYYQSIISYKNHIYSAGGMVNQENYTVSEIFKFSL